MNVAGDQQVDEVGRVRAFDLDLTLDGNVPHADVLGEVPVLRQEAAILGAEVRAGVVRVVVGRVRPASRRLREMPPRRLPDAGGYEHPGVAVPALSEVDRHLTPLETVDHQSLRHLSTSR